MRSPRSTEYPPNVAAAMFAEKCDRNVERFAGGLNGRARESVHDMELTEIFDGTYRIYLPACHTAVFGMEPDIFQATADPVDCKSCQRQSPSGRAAPCHPPRHLRGANWQSRAQLAMAYPDDPSRRSGLWRV